MKKHMNFIHNHNNTEILSNYEFKQKKKELVEKHLTQENLKQIPQLYNLLLDDYRDNFMIKMENNIKYLYNKYRERYKFYGILENNNCELLYCDLLNIIFNNLNINLDLDIILENENFIDLVFNEFQLKNEL